MFQEREKEFLDSNRECFPEFSNIFQDKDEDSMNTSLNFSIDTISRVKPTDFTGIDLYNEENEQQVYIKDMMDASTQTILSFPPNCIVEFTISDFSNCLSPQLTPIKTEIPIFGTPGEIKIEESPEFKTPEPKSSRKEKNERYKQLNM